MSWFSEITSDVIGGFGNVMSKASQYSIPGLAMKAVGADNPIQKFYEDEFVNKKDLRGAEATTFMSGLPFIGGVVHGIEGINQLEDLYARTGKVPAYPGASGVGASGLGSALGSLTRKIEDGSNDLAEYYSGDRDINAIFDSVNGYTGRHDVHYADSNVVRTLL